MPRRRRPAESTPEPDLDAFADRLGHRFQRPELLRQALTHRSASDPARGQLDSNERLEFLGDRVLGLLMAEWLSERFAEDREGDLMRRYAVLVSFPTLAAVAEDLELGPMLRVPASEGRAGLRTRHTVLADAMEALLGALYLDGGLPPARALLRRLWAPLLEAQATPGMPAKSRLQEWLQARGHALPGYAIVSAAGPSHRPLFVLSVEAMGRTAQGTGETRRAAEEAAAEAWLAGLPG